MPFLPQRRDELGSVAQDEGEVEVRLLGRVVDEAEGHVHDPFGHLLVPDEAQADHRGDRLGQLVERATIAETTADVLSRKVGITLDGSIAPRLLRLFDDPARDDRSWVMSAAHSVSLPEEVFAGAKGDLVAVTPEGGLEGESGLLFDHDEIVSAAVADVRERYEFRGRSEGVAPDPDGFLGAPFTLHQLRKVHEAVVGDEMHKDNFNRRMKDGLRPVKERGEIAMSSGLRGRPATLYRRR